MAKRDKQLKYEEALDQVEQIIDQIESGEIGLEKAIEQSKQGMQLIKHCRDILDRAEKQIAELIDAEAEVDSPDDEGGDEVLEAEADEEPPF